MYRSFAFVLVFTVRNHFPHSWHTCAKYTAILGPVLAFRGLFTCVFRTTVKPHREAQDGNSANTFMYFPVLFAVMFEELAQHIQHVYRLFFLLGAPRIPYNKKWLGVPEALPPSPPSSPQPFADQVSSCVPKT